jgi:tetratricopeptide (TPR) repeat protein
MSEQHEAPAASQQSQEHSSSQPPSGLAMIGRLRAEAEAADDPGRKAILLHEAAELEERVAGDELGAAREYLAAFNLDGGFREPLEALVRILERRRSLKNLGRVLDSLSKIADGADERARAMRARATDAADVKNDRDEAREHLEQAVDADPADGTAWLMLELDAGLRGDADARSRALARRVELTTDPRWQALLRIDLAELRAAAGDVDDALDVLTEVVSSQDEAAFRACEVAERLARGADRGDREAWSLMQRGEIVLASLQEPIPPRGSGVPKALRRAGVASDAFVRAAAAYRGVGRNEEEVAALDRAIEVDPRADMPYVARIAAAVRLGDLEHASVVAKQLIEREARPELAVSLWWTIAEAALARGDRAGVLEAAERLLAAATETAKLIGADPASAGIVPKTLLADLLLDGSDPQRLLALLESDVAGRPTVEGRSRGRFQIAAVATLFANDAARARAAMEAALADGADALKVARLSVQLAATSIAAGADERAWLQSATEALASVATGHERSSALLSLGRFAAESGDRAALSERLTAIGEDAGWSTFSRVLRLAFAAGDGDALLEALSDGAEGEGAIALAVARAQRAVTDEARARALDALGTATEGDALALLVRALRTRATAPRETAALLRELAISHGEAETRDTLRIASALLLAGDAALDEAGSTAAELETNAEVAFAPVRAIWQRAAAAGEPDARRGAMEATAKHSFGDVGWSALERALDRLLSSIDAPEGASSEELLEALRNAPDPALARAGALLTLAWPEGAVVPDARDASTETLRSLGGDAARWIARSELRKAARDADHPATIAAAERWHSTGGGAPAALEMLIAAESAADGEAEVRGRLALGRSLTGAASQLATASAATAAHVLGQRAPALPVERAPDVDASLTLVEAEIAGPGAEPRRRERALRALCNLIEGSNATLLEMAAWSAMARSDATAARELFAEALRLAEAAEDPTRSIVEGAVEAELLASGGQPSAAWAEKLELLAAVIEKDGETAAAAELFEQVGHAWWDRIGDARRGERALLEAFQREPHRKVAFDRVFRAVRARKEDDALLAIVRRRLEVADEPPEIAKLFWEQARVLRGKGDRDGALASLENVTMLEPDHVGALALSAEIYVGRQQYAEAAAALDRLSRQPVPVQQKLGAGLGAADIYEGKLDEPAKALDVLVALDRAGLSDLPIHERIARAASRCEAWGPATTYLDKLIHERPEPAGRIEAARLCAAIWRDRVGDPGAAVPALVALLRESADDAEALEQLIECEPEMRDVRATYERSLVALRKRIDAQPTEVRTARLVSTLANALSRDDLAQVGLSTLVALGAATNEERSAATALVARLASAPTVALDDAAKKRLAWSEELGSLLSLFRVMGPTIAEAFGPTTDALGVGRRERVDARAGNPVRNEVAAWAGAFGIAEFELYVGGKDPDGIYGVPGETPSFVLGANVRAPLGLEHRARLVREVVALERGTTSVLTRDDTAIAAIIVASCSLVDVKIESPAYAVLSETQRLLGKAIARKTKKILPEIAGAVARGNGVDLRSFRGLALRTLDRAGLLGCGDPATALGLVIGGAPSASKLAGDARAVALMRWSLSDDYLSLRKQLGLGNGVKP